MKLKEGKQVERIKGVACKSNLCGKIIGWLFLVTILAGLFPASPLYAAAEKVQTAQIPVVHQVTGEQIPEGVKFDFLLKQVDASGTEITSGIQASKTVTTVSGQASYSFVFDLGPIHDGTYYFTIQERSISPSLGWESLPEAQMIKVLVSDGTATIPNPNSTKGDGLLWEAPGTNGNPFGSGNYFSVLCFENFSVQGADVESGLAVGGELQSTDQYSLGKPYKNVGWPVSPHSPRLLVKGNIDMPGQLEVWGGTIVVTENSIVNANPARAMEYIGSDDSYCQGDESDFREYDTSVVREPEQKIVRFFNNAEADLKLLSQNYKELNGAAVKVVNCMTGASHPFADINNSNYIENIYFDSSVHGIFPNDYVDFDTIVFNLTLDGFSGNQAELRSIYMSIPDDYDGNIIFNVLPGAGINKLRINTGAMFINDQKASYELAREYSDRIIWNFPSGELDEISVNKHLLIGSVLAPNTAFIPNEGSVDGTLVAKSVTAQGGWETHAATRFGHNKQTISPIDIIFSNAYKAPQEDNSVSVAIKGSKILTGKSLEAGQFTFALLADGIVLDLVSNAGDGSITFTGPYLEYQQPGTYTYTMLECGPSAAISNDWNIGQKPGSKTPDGNGWVYDSSQFEIEVEVSDRGGYLEAVLQYKDGAADFHNNYSTSEFVLSLIGNKTVEGNTLTDNQFEFGVFDEENTLAAHGTNDASGVIAFDKITLNKPGIYQYTVKELSASANGWKKDDNVYKITVTVTDNGRGSLTGSIEYPDGKLNFHNIYTPTKVVLPKTNTTKTNSPKTGDTNNMFLYLVILAAASLTGVTGMIMRHYFKTKNIK